jgi:hypothetical protein
MNFHACNKRKVSELETPLLVPSFSSKGIQNIGKLHYYLKDSLADASLISAYDLHHSFIQHDNIFETDIVFVDSGGYERNQDHDLSEIYSVDYVPKSWTFEMYEEEVNKIEPIANMVLVNYDVKEPIPLYEQVELARNHFRNYPSFTSDFLCKPIAKGKPIDVENLISHIHLLSNFNILGLTEKELGGSVLERCTNIYRIRLALNKVNMNMPLHIFGCLDPINILVYFLSGADIFDGLSWLRFAFNENTPTYFNNHAILSGKWHLDDLEARVLMYSENIQQLSNLKMKMVEFIETRDLNILGLQDDTLAQVTALMKEVYRDFHEEGSS